MPQSETLRDAVLVFDEFTGFTPIQNDLMRELLQVTEHIYITLTIDAAEDFYHCSGNEELFALSKKTILSLMKMAEELHVQVMVLSWLRHWHLWNRICFVPVRQNIPSR